jgi:hypothetical protein
MQRVVLLVGMPPVHETMHTASRLNQIEKSNPFLGVYAASP